MRHRRYIRGAGPSRRLIVAVTAALVLVATAPAYGYWAAVTGASSLTVQTATLATPSLTATPVTATSVTLSWTQPFSPTGYTLSQSAGTLTGCSATPGTGTTTCTASGLTPDTAYTWTLTAALQRWTATATATSTTSRQATTSTLGSITPTSALMGSSFAATATVSGYGTPAGTVVFSLYSNSSCTGTASYATPAQTLAHGAVTGTLLPAAGTYYWQAAYTPTDSYNAASTSACSSAVTVTSVGSYAAISTAVTTPNSVNDVIVNYPAGTASGDLVLLVVVNSSSQAASVGAGWTQIAAPNGGGALMELQAFWHVAGSETSVQIAHFPTGTGAAAWVVDYKNVPSPTLVNATSGHTLLAGSITPPVVTAGANNIVISLAAAVPVTGALSLGTTQGFTSRATVSATVGLSGFGLGVADRAAPPAGSVNAPGWSEPGLGSQWAFITVAFS